MDVITIYSSDDEEAAGDTDGKERIMMTSTLCRTLSAQSDANNSSISSDDIWKTIGLSSRPKKDGSGADNDALLGNFKGRCIISPSEGGKIFEHSSVHTVCNVHCVTAPSRKSKETPIIPLSDSDDSSISSADSIWDKAGLPLRSKGDGAASPRIDLPLDNGNDLEISLDLTAPKSDHVRVSECVKDCSSVSSAKFGVSEDLCVIAPSRKSKETPIIPLSDFDDSSISSADSIWDKAGLPPRSNGDGAASPLIDLPLANGNDLEISLNLTAPKSDHVRVSVCAKDISSVSSAKFGVSEDLCVIAPSRKSKETPIIPLSDSDDSSISSADSIWDKAGLAPRSKGDGAAAPRIDLPLDSDNESKISVDQCVDSLPPEVPLPTGGTWRIVLLMDHREFGCANNFLSTVEKKINNGGNHAEITTLPSADYMFVARLISDSTGVVIDERVLDMVIERKNVQDACQCLIADSKKFKPLSFFEAQMYKLQHCGVSKKLFLMEGDEDKAKNIFAGAKSNMEKERRLKRVKTLRLQLENGEFEGVDLLCTRNRHDTVKFLIHQLEKFKKSFNPRRPPTKTMEQLKLHINAQMKAPTFLEYLRLRSQPGIGDAKAMKVIMDYTLDWDKSFVSPSSYKLSKSCLNDRATFWPATSINVKDRICINPYRSTFNQPSAEIKKASKRNDNCQNGSKCI